jgi:hypothetical protein
MHVTALINVAIVVGLVLFLMFGIARGGILENWYLAAAMPASIVGLMLMGRLPLLWGMTVATFSSNLVFGNVMVHTLLAIAFSGAGILAITMHRLRDEPMPKHYRFLVGLLLVSVVVGMIRGIGIRGFGGTVWGGGAYFTLWGALGFVLVSHRISMSEKNLIRAIILMLVLGALPGLIRLFNEASGGLLNVIGVVMRSVSTMEQYHASGQGVERLSGIQGSGGSLIMLSMALMFWRRASVMRVIALSLMGVVILGLAGFRGAFMSNLLVIVAYYWLMRRQIPSHVAKPLIFFAGFAVLALIMFSSHLPLSFQRMLSWIPGIEVDQAAFYSAQATTEWRLEMWRLMLPMIPDYLIIGRGLGFQLADAYAAYTLASDHAWHQFLIATHDYHNGPLYLLLDYGLAGFLCAFGFMFAAVRHQWGMQKASWNSMWLRNLHALSLARLLTVVFMFIFVFGDLMSLVSIFVDVALMNMLIKVDQKQKAEAAPVPETQTTETRIASVRSPSARTGGPCP